MLRSSFTPIPGVACAPRGDSRSDRAVEEGPSQDGLSKKVFASLHMKTSYRRKGPRQKAQYGLRGGRVTHSTSPVCCPGLRDENGLALRWREPWLGTLEAFLEEAFVWLPGGWG